MNNTPELQTVTKPQFLNFNYLATTGISRSRSSSMNPKNIWELNRPAGSFKPTSNEDQYILPTSFFTDTTVTNKPSTYLKNLKINSLQLVTAPPEKPKTTLRCHKLLLNCHKLSQAAVTNQKHYLNRCTPKNYADHKNFCNSVTAASDEKIKTKI